jgi:hypothetical protein
MILTLIASLTLAAQPITEPLDRASAAWIICNYVGSPACAGLSDEQITDREWEALLRPFPGWQLQAAGFPEDVCTERSALRTERACYLAWLRESSRLTPEEQSQQWRLFCDEPRDAIPDNDPCLTGEPL